MMGTTNCEPLMDVSPKRIRFMYASNTVVKSQVNCYRCSAS